MGSGVHGRADSHDRDDDADSGLGLEEIVVRQNSTPRRRRKSSEEQQGSTPRRDKGYPKDKRRSGEEATESQALLRQDDQRPQLLHARSEPSSRLQFFALNNRLFQPHSHNAEAPDLELRGESAGPSAKFPTRGQGDREGEWYPASGGGQEGLPWAQESRRPVQLPPVNTRPFEGFRPPTPGQEESSSAHSRHTPGSEHFSVSDLPEPGAAQAPASRQLRRSVTGSEAGGVASNGLSAVQMLAKEEEMRTMMRGESLSSTRGNSLRSCLRAIPPGGREGGGGGMLRAPTMVDLPDVRPGLNGLGERDTPAAPAALPGFAVVDDALPLPRANGSLRAASLARRVTWREQDSPLGATPVVDHQVAGDLHLGGPVRPAAAAKAAATPRTNRASGDRPKGGDTPRSSDMPFDDEAKDEKQLAEEEQHRLHWYDFWKHYRFWAHWAPAIWFGLCFVLGTAVYIWERRVTVAYFYLWSWLFFLGSLPALYWASRLVVHCLVLAVESTLFTTKQVIYYTYGVRKPLARFLRVCMVLPIFVGCFSSRANDSHVVHDAYTIMVRLLGCGILFFFANVLKAFLGKVMATHFHKEAHFKKLQGALQKEYYVMALSQPRSEVSAPGTSLAKRASEALLGDHGGSVAGTDRRSQAEGAAGAAPGGRRSSGVYDRLVKGLPRLKKGGSLPDLVQAEQTAHADRERAAAAAAAANPSPGESPVAVLRRPSMQQPMRPFLGRVSPSGPSLLSRSQSTQRDRPERSERPDKPAAAGDGGSVAGSQRSQRSTSHRPVGKFLLRTAAFKKDAPPAESVTELTTALEGVQDARNNKSFDGNLIRQLNAAEKHIRKNKLKVSFADQLGSAAHKTAVEQEVASKQEAKRLAFYLFWNVKPYFDRNHILQEDLYHFLPPNKAAKAFELLDVDQDGRVSLHDIRDAVLQIYKERKDLAMTLKDTRTITGKLETVIGTVVHVFFVLLYLFVFQVNVNKVWLTFSSMVVAFSFIFATAISNLFQAVIFLFVVHPFDVGDGVLINTDMHYVEEISLQNCVLKRWDGARLWYPNTVLMAAPLINMTRSGCKWESFTLYIDIGTPSEFFAILNKRIEEHMEANAGELSGEFACFNFGLADPLKLKLGVYFEFSHSGTDLGRLNVARHGLATCICDTLNAHGVRYSMPAFSGPRAPGFGEVAGTEMARPLNPPQAPPSSVMHTAASSYMTARQAHQHAVAAQYPHAVPAPPPDGIHPPFMQRFS